jgi:DNA-binding IscR family transcriptional regulator
MLPAYHLAERKSVPGADFADALAVLGALARAHADGRAVSLRRLIAQLRLMPHRCESILERSRRLGWAARTESDGWVLARDADSIRVADLYREFVVDFEAIGFDQADLGLSLREYSDKERA